MSAEEIEDFWCAAHPPIERVWFDDAAGFASFFVLMRDGSISAHLDSATGDGAQVLADALAYFRS